MFPDSGSFLASILIVFHVFGIPFFENILCLLFFWFPTNFGTLDPRNARFYNGKTNTCRKSFFLKQIEKTMISCSLLASFWHHCSCFSVTEFWIIFGWYLLVFLSILIQERAPGFASFGTHFWYLFDHGPQGCLWRFLGWFWLCFWLQFGCFGTFLVPFWHRNLQQRERESKREREIYFATISVYTLVFAPWHLWRAAEGRLDAAVLLQVATTRIHALRL